MNVIEFKDTQGRPVVISTQNYFAATLLEEREGGDAVWQVVSTGGFGLDLVVPKGQDLKTWLRAE